MTIPQQLIPNLDDVVELCEEFGFELNENDESGEILWEMFRAVLARYARPTIQPVPVSERLPGPEDCDAEGRCWWWHTDHYEDAFDDGWILLNPKWAGGRRDSDDSLIYTHWAPYWALPVPAPANNTKKETLK